MPLVLHLFRVDELLGAKREIYAASSVNYFFFWPLLPPFSFTRFRSLNDDRTNLTCFVITYFDNQSALLLSLIMTRNLNKVSSKLYLDYKIFPIIKTHLLLVDSVIPNFHDKLLRIHFTREMFHAKKGVNCSLAALHCIFDGVV